jgi:hypothetical protein
MRTTSSANKTQFINFENLKYINTLCLFLLIARVLTITGQGIVLDYATMCLFSEEKCCRQIV